MPTPADSPEISVIVPVRNGERTLGSLLDSLERQTLPRDRFEVIVVDNASTDATVPIARARGATVLHEPIPSYSRPRNLGASVARSVLYAFIDADCRADPRWLQALLECSSMAPLVAGEVKVTVSKRPNAIEKFETLWRFGQKWWVEQGWAATANLLVHADAFHAVGGFDPSWRYGGEDVDFCFRAAEAGFRLAYCSDAIAEHEGERMLGPMLRRCFRHGYAANQALHRLGFGHSAWRDPRPALSGDRALRQFGHTPDRFEPREWRRMARLARLGYGVRVLGSAWAEVLRAR